MFVLFWKQVQKKGDIFNTIALFLNTAVCRKHGCEVLYLFAAVLDH